MNSAVQEQTRDNECEVAILGRGVYSNRKDQRHHNSGPKQRLRGSKEPLTGAPGLSVSSSSSARSFEQPGVLFLSLALSFSLLWQRVTLRGMPPVRSDVNGDANGLAQTKAGQANPRRLS